MYRATLVLVTVVVGGVQLMCAVPASATPAGVSEGFDYANEAEFEQVWTVFGPNRDLFNNFSDLGWSDTKNATGANQGELGGTFGRVAEQVSFYNFVADQFNDPWTLDTPLRFRAKAYFENINYNWGLGLGFAKINDVTGERQENLGLWVLEPPEDLLRTGTEIYTEVLGANLWDNSGGAEPTPQRFLFSDGQPVNIEFEYLPEGGDFGFGTVTYTMNDAAGNLIGQIEWPLQIDYRQSGTTFNAFGLYNGEEEGNPASTPGPEHLEAFFDDVCWGTSFDHCGGDPPPEPGDANNDGAVDTTDVIALLAAAKFETGMAATFAEGDFDGDGVFATSDIVAMLAAGLFETGPYRALQNPDVQLNSIPEPSTVVLLSMGLAGVLSTGRRRRR